MMSAWMMKALLVQYLALAICCFWERTPWPGCYWLGASLITWAILNGMR